MNAAQALAYVEEHGVVLVAAKGPVPRLTEAIAGEPIEGSWWGHPKGREIYRVLTEVTGSEHILVCRAVRGKITLVHRRLWPALVRIASRFPPEHIAVAQQVHTASGHHESRSIPFPAWVSAEVRRAAESLDEAAAVATLGGWVPSAQDR